MFCFMWSGALDISDLLLSYPSMSLALPMTNILISTLKHQTYKHIYIYIFAGDQSQQIKADIPRVVR